MPQDGSLIRIDMMGSMPSVRENAAMRSPILDRYIVNYFRVIKPRRTERDADIARQKDECSKKKESIKVLRTICCQQWSQSFSRSSKFVTTLSILFIAAFSYIRSSTTINCNRLNYTMNASHVLLVWQRITGCKGTVTIKKNNGSNICVYTIDKIHYRKN